VGSTFELHNAGWDSIPALIAGFTLKSGHRVVSLLSLSGRIEMTGLGTFSFTFVCFVVKFFSLVQYLRYYPQMPQINADENMF